MPRHLTVNDETAVCGPFLGELADDSYTTDPDDMDCMECEALLGRPQDVAAVARAYAQGYADGKEKTYLELENWRPADHTAGVDASPALRPGGFCTRFWARRRGGDASGVCAIEISTSTNAGGRSLRLPYPPQLHQG